MMTDRELIELILSDPQQRIEALERDNAELREDLTTARDQIGALQLLRAYDIGFNQRARVEDQKRIRSLEWNMDMLFEGCR